MKGIGSWSRLILLGGATAGALLPMIFLNLSPPSSRRAFLRAAGPVNADHHRASIGCYKLDGSDYHGSAQRTLEGKRCQAWSSQVPNMHEFSAEKQQEWGLESNFCRNPTSEAAPWCFLADEVGWGYCDVPRCKDPNLKVQVKAELLNTAGGEENTFKCPKGYSVDVTGARAMRMYDSLSRRSIFDGKNSPLHYFSFYGKTSLLQWDELVRAHVRRLNLQPGQSVFESGIGAGAFLDSLSRQYGVKISGIDVAQDLIAIARQRLSGTFCAASAWNLTFVPSNSFDVALSFAVFMYIENPNVACKVAKELLRIVKPGGFVFLGQINDPEMLPFKPKGPEGSWGIPMFYWYRFARNLDVEVEVLRGEEMYSRRVIPELDHYDLHAGLRYNVYLRKKSPRGPLDPEVGVHKRLKVDNCFAFHSSVYHHRTTESGQHCISPFKLSSALNPITLSSPTPISSVPAVYMDSCTAIGLQREWCQIGRPVPESSSQHLDESASKRMWDFCLPLAHVTNETGI